jgi:hypothetical protein
MSSVIREAGASDKRSASVFKGLSEEEEGTKAKKNPPLPSFSKGGRKKRQLRSSNWLTG